MLNVKLHALADVLIRGDLVGITILEQVLIPRGFALASPSLSSLSAGYIIIIVAGDVINVVGGGKW